MNYKEDVERIVQLKICPTIYRKLTLCFILVYYVKMKASEVTEMEAWEIYKNNVMTKSFKKNLIEYNKY